MAKEFKLQIVFDAETKHCKLTGPINDPDLCLLGLIAKRFIVDHRSELKNMTLPGMSAPPKVQVQMPNFKELLQNGG